MQQQDQSEKIEVSEKQENLSSKETLTSDTTEQSATDSANGATQVGETSATETGQQASAQTQRRRFNWPALIAALAVAAFFALTARFNSLPAPSYVPATIFSATGCGLLVTAIRKLRKWPGAGLLEAGLSGFGMALLQFAMTFTYPGVFQQLTTDPSAGHAFLLTWALIALFAVILSLAGATIGHLAFASLRPLPARAQRRRASTEDNDEENDDAEDSEDDDEVTAEETSATSTPPMEDDEAREATNQEGEAQEVVEEDDETRDEEEEEEETRAAAAVSRQRRSLLNYAITVLLLGLLPMMAGYVFAATYDFIMSTINASSFSPAFYPTLSVLSGLLPWRLAAPITVTSSTRGFVIFTLFWRVPDGILGNPNLFDVQALEGLLFSAVGLALLLITVYGSNTKDGQRRAAPWGAFLLLQALLGLILVLPSDLWLLRGLQGILQFQTLLAQLPTVQLLNPTLFILNLLTGTLFTLLVGLIVRRQYQLWTSPRAKTSTASEGEHEEKGEEE
ncbi:MAG TPA: hypothetical protein VF458_21490 [Ktedonobacteraceae bacterium]